MEFYSLSLGQLQTNGYIVAKDGQALVIDPGADEDRIVEFLTSKDLTPIAVLLTHAHFDHIGAVDRIKDIYSIPVYIHEAEKDWLMNPKLNSSTYFPLGEIIIKPAEHSFTIGSMSLASFQFEVIHTPGHSPGGVSFIFKDQETIISGDCLFQRGIGRTDLVGGDHETLIKSIQKLYQLPDHYKVLPGHGPATIIGEEKAHNPFVRG